MCFYNKTQQHTINHHIKKTPKQLITIKTFFKTHQQHNLNTI